MLDLLLGHSAPDNTNPFIGIYSKNGFADNLKALVNGENIAYPFSYCNYITYIRRTFLFGKIYVNDNIEKRKSSIFKAQNCISIFSFIKFRRVNATGKLMYQIL